VRGPARAGRDQADDKLAVIGLAGVVLATHGGGTALTAPGAGEDENVSLERLFVASDDEVWIANPGTIARDRVR